MMLRLPEVLLLDLDDTLVSFSAGGDFWPAAYAACAPADFAVDSARFCAAVSRVSTPFWADTERAFRGRMDLVWARRQVVQLAFAELGLPPDELAHAIADRYTWQKEDAVTPFAGALETLHALRERGVRLGLITNGCSDFQRRKLTRHALEAAFETVLIEGEFGVGKPHASIFQEALRLMRVSARDAWMVGDNLVADIGGAQACGIHAVWNDHARGGLPADSAILPDRVIHHVQDLLQLQV